MAVAFTAAQARASDEHAMSALGLPGLVLMENAGRGVADVVMRTLATRAVQDACVAVVCGAGHNGGDGFVVARHLSLLGIKVHVVLALPRALVTGDALVNLRALETLDPIAVTDGSACGDEATWRAWLGGADVVVDAVFGTGLKRDIVGVPALAVCAMNAAPGVRVAVDLPSGLDADTGRVRGVAVHADVTATMAARKLGMVLDATTAVGDIVVIDLGAPVFEQPQRGPFAHWIDEQLVRPWLPRLHVDAHKGTRGHLLLVAGSEGKTGAAVLAGTAAMRAGAGLVTIATTHAAQAALDAKLWEVMSVAMASGDDASDDSYAQIIALSARMKALAVGPGIPTGPGMAALVRRLVVQSAQPMVVDADALNHLGQDGGILANAQGARVLTPHPGEMARLMGVSVADIQSDRLAAVRGLAATTRCVVVLKGARTLVAEPDGTVYINPSASSALATAGSGDVLTGVIGGLMAQGLTAIAAAVCGVFLHGHAADEACARLGVHTLVASDLPIAIARVQAELSRHSA